MAQPNDTIPELYLAAVKSSAELMNVWLDAIERLQNYQVEAIGEFRSAHSEMSQQVGAIRSPQEWSSTQVELLRQQLAGVTGYWSGLYATACQNQVEMLRDGQARADAATQDLTRKLEAVPAGVQPVVSALKQMFGVAGSTYAATVRATEEMARISAAQVDAATAKAAGATRQARARRAA